MLSLSPSDGHPRARFLAMSECLRDSNPYLREQLRHTPSRKRSSRTHYVTSAFHLAEPLLSLQRQRWEKKICICFHGVHLSEPRTVALISAMRRATSHSDLPRRRRWISRAKRLLDSPINRAARVMKRQLMEQFKSRCSFSLFPLGV